MSTDFDFSCIPCAGKACFPKPTAERQACTREVHHCPKRLTQLDWLCRCCWTCRKACEEEHYGPG